MQKIKNTGFIIICLVLTAATHAQAQYYYASKGLERKGVTEYLFVSWNNTATYWTNAHPEQISLNVLKIDATNRKKGFFYTVSFPKSKRKYRFHQDFKKKQLVCTHPNGKKQVFEALPRIFISKDFERKGVTEYLEDRDGKLYYYTSANQQKKVELLYVRTVGMSQHVYRFPGSKKEYAIGSELNYSGNLVCKSPDGHKQVFKLYNWRD